LVAGDRTAAPWVGYCRERMLSKSKEKGRKLNQDYHCQPEQFHCDDDDDGRDEYESEKGEAGREDFKHIEHQGEKIDEPDFVKQD